MDEILTKIQNWYSSQCNQEWEHSYGIEINTIDNPGWSVKIDLTNTELENKQLAEVKDNYESETDWLLIEKKEKAFIGHCGPKRLKDILEFFLKWQIT